MSQKPKLPPRTKTIFDTFILHAPKDHLHQDEWSLFYRFVCACHGFRVKLEEEELVLLLLEAGFTERLSRELGGVYYHIREYLKKYKRRPYTDRDFYPMRP
jgi:hypothetical protein